MDTTAVERFADIVGRDRMLTDPIIYATLQRLRHNDDAFAVLAESLRVACDCLRESQKQCVDLLESQPSAWIVKR